MPETSTVQLSTAAAITRARQMIDSGQKLAQAATTVDESRGTQDRHAAERVKESRLLDYRVVTIPGALAPVLEALILAASQNSAGK